MTRARRPQNTTVRVPLYVPFSTSRVPACAPARLSAPRYPSRCCLKGRCPRYTAVRDILYLSPHFVPCHPDSVIIALRMQPYPTGTSSLVTCHPDSTLHKYSRILYVVS